MHTLWAVPIYEFRCRQCDERFELRRSMADADEPARCSAGHPDVVRLLAAFSATGKAGAPVPTGGCGGACACAS